MKESELFISEKDFAQLEKPEKSQDPGMLSESDWNDIEADRYERLRRARRNYWEFKREMDMRWREGQDAKITDFLKLKYEQETRDWFSVFVKKKLKKKYKRVLSSVYLVRHDSYCYHVDVVGVLKGSNRKVRLVTRRVMLLTRKTIPP